MKFGFADGTVAAIDKCNNVCVGSEGRMKRVQIQSLLKNLCKAGKMFGTDNVYNQFCLIYDLTREDQKYDQQMFQLIRDMCDHSYNECSLIIQKTFVLLYLKMKSFFLDSHAFVQKAILRLQVMEILQEGQSIEEVMQQTHNMSVRELFLECCKRAFGDFDSDQIDCPEIIDTDCELEEWSKAYVEKRRSHKGD